ncbi:protoporphyrinogen oxidase [Metallococcus carri]|uniref:protoporphyrinogen oxidase n=1 Tax=Metallococcus carri TaxID=1656884 RepID=UPI001583443F|nr:protoporphyrinogen oxidase [Metallococcus carri]
MGKLSFLAGFAAGYVVGARAGEERYEQIKLQAGKAWQHPAVQSKVNDATAQIKQRGPEVAAAAGQAAIKGAGTAAKSAVSAGYQAATTKNKGPVVKGSLADPVTSADVEGTHPDADTDSGDTKLTDGPSV